MKTSFCLLGSILLVVVHVCQAAPFGMNNGYLRPPGFPGPQGPLGPPPMPAMLAYIQQPAQMFDQIMRQDQNMRQAGNSGQGYSFSSGGSSDGNGFVVSSSSRPNNNFY